MIDHKWYQLFIDIHHPNTYFDHIYYVNLDKRIDRYQSINNQLIRHKINATKISGIIPDHNHHCINDGQLGCLLSHKAILENALSNRYQTILILEDDTIFKENFIFLFSRFINNLPNIWDMIYLCGNHYGGIKPINKYVYQSYGTLSTNAYAINKPTMITMLELLNNTIYHQQPIDSLYCSIHPKIQTFVSVPNLCYQMAGFSDIENKITDYDILK